MTQKETTEKEYVEIPFSNVVQVAYDIYAYALPGNNVFQQTLPICHTYVLKTHTQ